MTDIDREAILAAALAKAGGSTRLDIMGAHEAKRLLGVSNQRFQLMRATRPDFPKPDAKLQATPVWQGRTMRAFARAYKQEPRVIGARRDD
jgi:hypothetical protein